MHNFGLILAFLSGVWFSILLLFRFFVSFDLFDNFLALLFYISSLLEMIAGLIMYADQRWPIMVLDYFTTGGGKNRLSSSGSQTWKRGFAKRSCGESNEVILSLLHLEKSSLLKPFEDKNDKNLTFFANFSQKIKLRIK